MKTSARPAGHYDDYVMGLEDHRGDPRPEDPIRLVGDGKLGEELALSLAPPFVNDDDRERRRVRHLWRHVAQLVVSFSEERAVVEECLPRVILDKENLLSIGLHRDNLSFTWTEHPEEPFGTHAHGELVLVLLPSGGPFDPRLFAGLNRLHDRLLSHRLGLTDPLDDSRFPLVLASDYSYRRKNRPLIESVLQAVHACHNQLRACGQRIGHDMLLDLLREAGLTLLASDDEFSEVCQWRSREFEREFGAKLWDHTVLTVTRDGELLYWEGPLCRVDFKFEMWEQKQLARRTAIQELQQQPGRVFERFWKLLDQLEKKQKALKTTGRRPPVRCDDFAWLRESPVPRVTRAARPSSPEAQTGTYVLEPFMYGSALTYPFSSDWDEPPENGGPKLISIPEFELAFPDLEPEHIEPNPPRHRRQIMVSLGIAVGKKRSRKLAKRRRLQKSGRSGVDQPAPDRSTPGSLTNQKTQPGNEPRSIDDGASAPEVKTSSEPAGTTESHGQRKKGSQSDSDQQNGFSGGAGARRNDIG